MNMRMHDKSLKGLGEPLLPIDAGLPYGYTAKRGDRGPLVQNLQKVIASNGYPVKIDGVFGAETETAIKLMQQKFAKMGAPANLLGPAGVWTQELTGVYASQFRKIPGASQAEIDELKKSGLVFASSAPKETPTPKESSGGAIVPAAAPPAPVPSPGSQVVTPNGQIVTPPGSMPDEPMLYTSPQPQNIVARAAASLNIPVPVLLLGGGAVIIAAAAIGYQVVKNARVAPQPQVAFMGLPKKRKYTKNRKKKA
jgi:hypothetical protein